MNDLDWPQQAACRDCPDAPAIFFPNKPKRGDPANHGREAKAICATCPVRYDCLVSALERHETEGIWGGAGGDQLRALSRSFRLRQHPPQEWCGGCRWCIDLEAFQTGQVVDRNGKGATHGRRITYARGCRCGPCRAAADQIGQASTANGLSYRIATLAERRCIPTRATA